MALDLRASSSGSTSASKNRVKKTLFADVFFYITTNRDPFSIQYFIECNRFTDVSISIDWTNSKNVIFQPSPALLDLRLKSHATEIHELSTKLKIRAFSSLEIGTVKVIDPYESSSVHTSYSYQEESPDEEEIREFMILHHAEMKKTIEVTRELYGSVLKNLPEANITIATANETFSQYGHPFLDLTFVPEEYSIFHTKEHIARLKRDGNYHRFEAIEWKRPPAFMKTEDADSAGEIQVFKDGIEPADIIQGFLGDCWFLSALAALAEIPILVESLFPEESRQYSPAGIYQVRFCKNGIWQTVTVDDYFPCFPGSGPIFSRSHGNELWVLLAEKAYSKLHHSYLGIQSGVSVDALMDLTGAPCFIVPFPKVTVPVSADTIDSIWLQMMEGLTNGFLMSAGTRSETELKNGEAAAEEAHPHSIQRQISTGSIGLVFGHAYTIITLRETSRGDRLIKLRNPWGSIEWKGDWSDQSSKWTEEMKEEIENIVEADDGVFWMCLQDLLYYFDSVNICMIRIPQVTASTPWYEYRQIFAMEFPVVAGGSQTEVSHHNSLPLPPPAHSALPPAIPSSSFTPDQVEFPIFRLTVMEQTSIIVTIHQKDTRCPNTPAYLDVGFLIVQATTPFQETQQKLENNQFQFVSAQAWKFQRQNQGPLTELAPGEYYVIPFTTGCKLAQFRQQLEEKNLSTGQASMVVKEEEIPPLFVVFASTTANTAVDHHSHGQSHTARLQMSNLVMEIYTEIFHRLDRQHRGYLTKSDLDQFTLRTTGHAMSQAVYDYFLTHCEPPKGDKRGITVPGFLAGQLYILNQLFQQYHYQLAPVEEVFHREIENYGYCRQSYQWKTGRSMVLSVHSLSSGYQVQVIPYHAELVQEAQRLYLQEKGTRQEYSGRLTVYSVDHGYEGTSLLVANPQEHRTLEVTMDVGQSKNLLTHRNETKYKTSLLPQQSEVMFHLIPEDTTQSWSSSYRFEYH